jgi:CDP-glucose 4,6-dehydratase
MSNWLRRQVLVTGAGGLVGSWLVDELLARHARVVCLVRDRVPDSRFFAEGLDRRVTVVDGDICDQAAVERALGEYEVATVFHLAAQTIVPIANRNPASTFESNVRGTWVVLEACRRSPLVREVVVASSDKAYGEQDVLPYSEDMPLRGANAYDVSKTCADLIAQAYAHTWDLPVAVTRCGNFYGGGDLNFSRLVPGVLRDVLHGQRPVIRSDGSFVRDYIHVEDGVSAYLATAEALAARPDLAGRAFNFSLERPLSVLEMVDEIQRAAGTDLEPVILNEATNEIHAQYLNSKRARAELSWEPAVGLEEGLRRTVEWYRRYFATN